MGAMAWIGSRMLMLSARATHGATPIARHTTQTTLICDARANRTLETDGRTRNNQNACIEPRRDNVHTTEVLSGRASHPTTKVTFNSFFHADPFPAPHCVETPYRVTILSE